jgi:hypothetical protein
MYAILFIYQQISQGGFMSRFSKWTMLPAAMFLIFAGTTLGATRYVPSQYSTIQAAITASSNGDVIIINSNLSNDPGFNVNKQLTIQGSVYYTFVCLTGQIQVNSNVTFQYLFIYPSSGTPNLVRTNSGTVDFIQCYLSGNGGASNYVVDDYGASHIYGYVAVFSYAGTGIDAYNTGYVYLNQGGSNGVNKCINYRNYSTGSGPYAQIYGCVMECSNSNGYCIRTSFPNKSSGTNWVGVQNSQIAAYDAGCVPIKLDGHSGADINNNTFNKCGTGYEWSKTSTDVIQSATGNTAASGSNCSPGPF